MKKTLITIFLIIMILTVAGVALVPQQADAAAVLTGAAGGAAGGAAIGSVVPVIGTGIGAAIGGALGGIAGAFVPSFDDIAAKIGNLILRVAAFFLSLAGIILNISIILTMNIKAVYLATPAIEDVWIVIRNISSIFIIFMLLYTSIQTILNIGSPNIKKLIGNVILAGLLINFSLFFTRILIDTSNLISLQFYRAIAPNSQNASIGKDGISRILSTSFTDGGISDVFMQSLQITKIYDPKSQRSLLEDKQGGAMFKIFVATVLGSGIMLMAGLSFIAAGIAFIIRLVILLLLMGFSPVFFAGMIFPKVKTDISDKWLNWLKQQLIFMPVYLLFMYIALRFISTINPSGVKEGFFAALGDAQAKASGTSSGIFLSNVGIILQYIIALILINIPLMAAVQTGGVATKWGESAKKWVGGWLGKNTAGRAAKWSSDTLAKSDFAARNPNMAIMANKMLGKTASASFGGTKGGYDKRFKDFTKERSEFLEKGIKLGGKEKQKITEDGIANWSNYNTELAKKIATQNALIADGTSTEEERRNATVELAKLTTEEKARKDAFDKGIQNKYLEEEALKSKKESAAKVMEKQSVFGVFTNKARKEAAESFRKEANKSEEKKILDKLKEMMKNADKDKEPKEDKPPAPKPPTT